MDINAMDSGSRVTRSLRKRLTSIDSDNSSRPGTPLSTKLASIAEVSASPSKSTRSTRRNSVSSIATPVKTPAKRGVSSSVIAGNLETPLPVRNTRRRSALTNDSDETCQAGVQISTSETSDQEIGRSNEQQTIITRSKSQSPQEENSRKSSSPKKVKFTADKQNEIEVNARVPSAKKRKPGPRSKTCGQGESDDMSDVEISVPDDVVADMKNKPSNMTIVLTDEDSNQISKQKKPFDEHADYSKPSSPNNVRVSESDLNNFQDVKPNTDENTLEFIRKESVHEQIPEISSESKIENGERILHDRIENKQEEIVREMLDVSEIENWKLGKNSFEENKNLSTLEPFNLDGDVNANSNNCKTFEVKENELNVNGFEKHEIASDKIFNDCMTPENKKTLEKDNILAISPAGSHDCKEVQKKVDFTNSPSNDTSIKVVYPKTPASTKAPICKKFESSSLENALLPLKSYFGNQDMEVTEDIKNSKNEKDIESQIGFECSHASEIDKISTPITCEQNLKIVHVKKQVVAENALKDLERNTHKVIDKPNVLTNNNAEEELKWINPSVKGNTKEGSKLDVVLTNAKGSNINKEDTISQNQTNRTRFEISLDDDVEVEDDENDYYEEEYESKNDYIDDEAMEVENYESGDSMDSKERMEIQLNEIPIDGESIGSQTTDDNEDEYAEEDDSADSFIVSDNEIMENSKCDTNEDEEIEQYANELKHQTNKKLYRRIVHLHESSSSSDEIEEQALENCSIAIQDTSNIQNEQKGEENSKSAFEEGENFEKISIDSKCQTKSNELFSGQKSSNKSFNANLDSRNLSDATLDKLPSEKYCEVLAENNDKDEHSILPSSEDIQTETQLEEESLISEDDANKKHRNKSSNLSSDRKCRELSISFENCRKSKENIECQRSLIIDCISKDGELGTKITNAKLKENESTDLSATSNQRNEVSENGIEYLESMRHTNFALGKPLIRTRRQSLALPMNPDMELCSTSNAGINSKKIDRKSCSVLSNIDFKPSQSFIENIELLKNEKYNLSAKRKLLSKSFGGSTEAHDHGILDINVSHLHKNSDLMNETSIEESDLQSAKRIDSRKISTQISSTPHERINTNNSYTERILTRCDEILEAANRAKLEAKIKNKKNKTKTSKKWKKRSDLSSSEEIYHVDKFLGSAPMDLKDKTKTAISQAFIAADAILNKPKISTLNKVLSGGKIIRPDNIETIRKTDRTKKQRGKEINQRNKKIENVCSTSAGNFVEFPQTPVKKKKVKYIKLSTGKISVEPITPKKNLVQAFNGRSFRESPLTPYAVGFKVKKTNLPENNMSPSTILRASKRKRYIDESFENITKPNAQWTPSGIFTEETISNVASKKTKPEQERKQNNVRQNFKENALSRPDINRSTKRELLLMKERKRACGARNNI